MSAAQATRPVGRHGWATCPACGLAFLREHHCRYSALGEDPAATRRPEGFDTAVEDARREQQLEQSAGEQLSLLDVAAPCTRCGTLDRPIDPDAMVCTSCLADDARALAARVAEYHALPLSPRRGPP